MRARQIATVALILGLTVAGFFGARALGERDARHTAEHRAAVAAAQIRGHIEDGSSLTESLRRSMVSVNGAGMTGEEFESNASRWLGPAGFPAAAWVEPVPASERDQYEERVGRPIVIRDQRLRIVPVGARPSYLPAPLVSGIAPMVVPGIDLGDESGVAEAVTPAMTRRDALATPLVTLRDGTSGLFLVRFAPRVASEVTTPGFVILFVSEDSLRAAAAGSPALQISVGGAPGGEVTGAPARSTFTEAGQRFDIAVPRGSVQGAAAVLPWIILVAGLVLAALAATLGVYAARRARAQAELDRLFNISSDLIAVADLDGRFTRVNPAVEKILGYTAEEFLARPFLEMVHPDDREESAVEMDRLREGKQVMAFENRYIRKDGSYRVLEWTSTPVLRERFVYGVARDVTERRRAETELRRLVEEQAALRRVATLVARGVSSAEVFAAVAEEVERLLDAQATTIGRLEPDGTVGIVASSGSAQEVLPVGTRVDLQSEMSLAKVVRTGLSASVDDSRSDLSDQLGIRCSVAVPIIVEGSLWGSIAAGTERDQFAPDAAQRMAAFTELAGTAIANADSRAELAASRRRIVAASDETRRQIERDLHDGTQQRLLSLTLAVRAAEANVPTDNGELRAELSDIALSLTEALGDLQELARGVHPVILTRGGLVPALRNLARRSTIPVELDLATTERLPDPIEAAAYFAASEALANATKHAHASAIDVSLEQRNGSLLLSIRDDGVGGADPSDGSGLVGLQDRIEALGGTVWIDSPRGAGTVLVVMLPLGGQAAEPAGRDDTR